jgi:hypothetical protein
MEKSLLFSICVVLSLVLIGISLMTTGTGARVDAQHLSTELDKPITYQQGFDLQVLVNGWPLEEYRAREKTYIEAVEGAEYEVRIRNPLPYRVAVALSVDGLNSIDARRTSAWNASKWVIGPYETIQLAGWQMSFSRARHFYFTTERDSYAARLGQTSNLGVISAVFFRELRPRPVTVVPPPRPLYEDNARDKKSQAPSASADSQGAAQNRKESITRLPDDEYAATGIGRSVQNEVRWVSMDLDSRPAAEITVRYEYYPALVKLGVLPRQPMRPDTLRRREGATGFEDRRFSPEP